MKLDTRKTTIIFLSLLALVGVFLSLLNFWQIRRLEKSKQDQFHFEKNPRSEADNNLLSESTSQSYEELRDINDQQNKSLKERSLKFSPNKKKVAYFQQKIIAEGENIGDNDYTTVNVEQGGKTEVVFQGDYHLSYFEWLDDREIVVYRSCGTECMIAYIVDTNTKIQQELALGVGYMWSPNKQYVVVYHYSYQYGISIANRGNQYGQTVLQVRRNHPPTGSGLINQTKVAWSQDSNKLAVVMRKDNEEKLELLVYDIEKQFKLHYQQDLKGTDISRLAWEGLNAVVLTEDGVNKKITFELSQQPL